jgi:hypothetical protein
LQASNTKIQVQQSRVLKNALETHLLEEKAGTLGFYGL